MTPEQLAAERDDYERFITVDCNSQWIDRDASGVYVSGDTRFGWQSWLARAKLDRGMPPLMELPPSEFPAIRNTGREKP